ncbi:MAG: hypothetical protein V1794_00830 [Candidatus Glassbacteria bacterium]
MFIWGIVLAILGIAGINGIWRKNEWRYSIFEICRYLELKTNLKVSQHYANFKKNGTIMTLIFLLLYVSGAVLIYGEYPKKWILIIEIVLLLWLSKAVVSLFRAAYSKKIRLLNFLYSPHILAWRRDHWSEYSDEQIAVAICQASGLDSSEIITNISTLDNYLITLCRQTRPEQEAIAYPKVLEKLHAQAERMIWNG